MIGSLFGDRRATPVVLTFQPETKVGSFVSLGALGGGRGVEQFNKSREACGKLEEMD